MRYDDVLIRQAQAITRTHAILTMAGGAAIFGPYDGHWERLNQHDEKFLGVMPSLFRLGTPYFVASDIQQAISSATAHLHSGVVISRTAFLDDCGFLWMEHPLMTPSFAYDEHSTSKDVGGFAWMLNQSMLSLVPISSDHVGLGIVNFDLDEPIMFDIETAKAMLLAQLPADDHVPSFDDARGGQRQVMETLRFFFAAILFMSQAILTTETHRANRSARKHAERSQLMHDSVKVIYLRRRANQYNGANDHEPVDWSHRWLVRGHWRNQPVGPKREKRQTIWVTPYVKGPEDKPLVVKPAAVRAVVR